MTSADLRRAVLGDRIGRAGDVLVSAAALVLLSPVIAGTALVVRTALGPGVLFRQPRPGIHGEEFEVLKFRTMLDPDPARGRVSDAQRMTRVGDLLRATSLDELPGLVSVLRGDMSLVGPRPLRMRYLDRYSEEQAHRHDVRPGLTGLAQISGRNTVSWDDRFDLDLEYVRTRGPLTDLRILLATVPKVLRREGIAEQGQATMTDFFGPRRLGAHALRAAPGGAREWEVVGEGDVLARCSCTTTARPDDRRCAELVVHVLRGTPDPVTVRDHAVEMLLGVAREQGAQAVTLRMTGLEEVAAPLPARLGLRATPAPVGARDDGAAVLVRELVEDRR